ncbi:MAG: chromosomal replication initiator protein DnaA [Candidatus Anammoxibacter sp.]
MTQKQLLLWNDVLKSIKHNITKEQYNTWFSKLSVNSFSEKCIEIVTPNLFVKECLYNDYRESISEAIYKICKSKPKLIFLCKSKLKLKYKKKSKSLNKCKYQTSNINVNYTFDNFVVGHCNRLAHAAAQSVIKSPGYMYNPLFIYGKTGMGKTHLLQSIYITLSKANNNVIYITCEDLINHLITSIEKKEIEIFRKKYRDVDILLIDDIQFLSKSEKSKDEFFHTFNALYNSQKQIVVSCDRLPNEIPFIEERLVSRFNWGLKCKLESPDIETKIAIIENKALSLNINLPLDVTKLLGENVTSNIREIEGTILKIKEKVSINKNEINIDLVTNTLYEHFSEKKNIGVEMILKVIAQQFDVNITKILSKNRLKSVTLPRQMAMYLARKLTNLSYNEIGGYFGGRDHTTIMYAYEKIKKSKTKDNETKCILQKMEHELNK